MKVGILAMVRDKKQVYMETGSELWTFGLTMDSNFGEEVLTVTIKKRHQSPLLTTTTITKIVGISEEEWIQFEQDFLFLKKPTDVVETPTGELLLDPQYMHKLYVKNFWIADMKEDGLLMGVNLKDMELDRDRRAVVKKGMNSCLFGTLIQKSTAEIERKISDIWTKAILQRKDLIPVYFDLLMQDYQVDFLCNCF